MSPVAVMSREEVQAALADLPGWSFQDNALERVVDCPTYRGALDLLYRIGELAEREDHHPDMTLAYKRLIIRYWTHTAQGVTPLDAGQAGKVEALIRAGC